MNEGALTSHARLHFADIGPLWRNNVGAMFDETGRLVRFGLGHVNKMKDDDPRSSDFIGITPEYVFVQRLQQWRWAGILTALEMKHTGWHQIPSDKRAIGQAAFHDIVRGYGGYAGFVTEPADIDRIIGR